RVATAVVLPAIAAAPVDAPGRRVVLDLLLLVRLGLHADAARGDRALPVGPTHAAELGLRPALAVRVGALPAGQPVGPRPAVAPHAARDAGRAWAAAAADDVVVDDPQTRRGADVDGVARLVAVDHVVAEHGEPGQDG